MNETSVAKIKESNAFARQFMVTKKTWPNNEVAIYVRASGAVQNSESLERN